MEQSQLKSAVTDYTYLRGLLTMAMGALIVIGGLSNLEAGPFRYRWVAPVAIALAMVVYWRLDRYYKEHFGRATMTRGMKVKVAVTTIVGMVAIIAAAQADWSLDLPICMTVAVFSAFMLGYAAAAVGIRAHHVVIWGGMIAIGLIPIWGNVTADQKPNFGLILVGVASIVSGWFDHVVLTRSFGAEQNAELENSSAGG
jgi:hypothetical protein